MSAWRPAPSRLCCSPRAISRTCSTTLSGVVRQISSGCMIPYLQDPSVLSTSGRDNGSFRGLTTPPRSPQAYGTRGPED